MIKLFKLIALWREELTSKGDESIDIISKGDQSEKGRCNVQRQFSNRVIAKNTVSISWCCYNIPFDNSIYYCCFVRCEADEQYSNSTKYYIHQSTFRL